LDRFKRVRDVDGAQWSSRYNQWKCAVTTTTPPTSPTVTTNHLQLRDGDQTIQPIGPDEPRRFDQYMRRSSPPVRDDAAHIRPDMFPSILVATRIDQPTPHQVIDHTSYRYILHNNNNRVSG
jgi:hypothetical protein